MKYYIVSEVELERLSEAAFDAGTIAGAAGLTSDREPDEVKADYVEAFMATFTREVQSGQKIFLPTTTKE